MPASEYLPTIFAGASVYQATQHNITNQHVTVDGDEALVWSYAICYHLEEPGNGRDDLIVATQYRDRCRRVRRRVAHHGAHVRTAMDPRALSKE